MSIVERVRRFAVRRTGAAAVPAASVAPRAAGWWDLLPFDTHRIEVAPGIWTIDDDRTPPVADARTMLVLQCLGGDLTGRSVVDLGSNEGGFTLAFARLGAERAIGVEARSVNVRRAELARTLLGIDNATFVTADLKAGLDGLGTFDVVFASGILYHLGDPADALVAIRRACTRVALIDTHVADVDAPSHGCTEIVSRQLGTETYSGRMFPEFDGRDVPGDRERHTWAAWSDAASFWPVERDLVRMLHAAGFARVGRVDPELITNGRHWAVDQRNRVCYLAWV